ncbi:hypothetical protein B5M09_011049 [Aphanomyces astaci]|uniref:EF-hand domain-containing protein n=1 Tax=Aphanomyces astaci TaxID=112090 RepID=A0A425CSA2_APHAT|nr:hypothetical protein B5M09_011049 [Aphanomyces astaci]
MEPYNFVEFALEWIFEDMHEIDLDKQMTVFADVFVPRWNAGALGYEYLYDGTTFEHQATLFEQKWDVDLNKYVFLNMETHDTHLVDPRKEDVLYALALEASGEVDVHELFTLLNESLCEPMTMDQVIQVMTSIDQDGTGTINFNEFYAWYGSEYSQKQIKSVKHDGLKLALRTRRQAKRIELPRWSEAGVEVNSSDPTLSQARDWLAQKQDEAAIDAATKRAASRRRREEQLHVLRRVQTSTKSGALKLAVAIKVMLFGQKLNRDAEVLACRQCILQFDVL